MNPKLFILFLIVLLITVWHFGIAPVFTKIDSLKQQITEEEKSLSIKDLEKARLESYEAQLSSLQKERDRMEIMLPSSIKEEELMVEIKELVTKSGMSLSSLAITPTSHGGDESVKAKKISLTLRTEGSYGSLKKFFALCYRDLRLMDIDRVSFGSSGSKLKGETIIYNFSIELTTYYY